MRMSANPIRLTPKFNVGNRVKVMFPGPYKHKDGVVDDVIEHKGDYVHRYAVRLRDGDRATFFEFELALLD